MLVYFQTNGVTTFDTLYASPTHLVLGRDMLPLAWENRAESVLQLLNWVHRTLSQHDRIWQRIIIARRSLARSQGEDLGLARISPLDHRAHDLIVDSRRIEVFYGMDVQVWVLRSRGVEKTDVPAFAVVVLSDLAEWINTVREIMSNGPRKD